ncbi:helix-turn-helix domain-containing protein [Streptomyces sp. NP160]|nr:helix-turn-helix domain-containing protein [Streptomyces sp. NP160]
MRERGWSYGDVARRSGLPRSTVHHLATTPIQRAPRPSRLEALAAALELPLSVLQAAVAEATGLSRGTVGVEPDTAVIVAGLADLSPDDRRHVAALVESLRAASARRVTPPTER